MSTTTNIKLFKHDNPATNTDEFNVDKALNQNWDKLDTAIGKDRERITTLETDNTTNKQDITDIKAKDTEQDKYIAELEAENIRLREDLNGLPKRQASGETIDLSDSAEMRCELKISGNSKQETRSGKNKIEITKTTTTVNGCTHTIKDGTDTLSGTSSTDWANLIIYSFVGDGKTYTLSGSPSTSKNIFISAHDKVQKKDLATSKNGSTGTFVATSGNSIDIIICVAPNLTLANELFKPQLEEGSKATVWEQGGAMPSPNYLSEVKCVTGDVNLTICNKNLAKINETDWTLTDNNTIKNKAKNVGSVLTEFYLKKGQTVKISLKLMSKPTEDTTLRPYINGKVTNMISSFLHINIYDIEKIYTKTYTATEDCTISFKLWGNSNSDIFEFQFWAELDNVTEYVQHKSQTYTIPTQQPFRSVGNTRDTFIKKDGKWYERHNITRKILNGTENWMLIDNNSRFAMKITEQKAKIDVKDSNKNLADCLSNRFAKTTQLNIDKVDNGIAFSQWSDTQYLYLSKIKDSINELKNYLAANETYVDYPLETPLDIECTEEQNKILDKIEKEVKTYKNVTHMYSTDKISSYKEVTYKQDLETRLNNVEQAILSQGGNI